MGERKENLHKAVSLLDEALGTPHIRLSSFIETEPWGFESEDKFLNAAVMYRMELENGYDPEEEGLKILDICKDVERKLGRNQAELYDKDGKRIYSSRPIDIDILLFGTHHIDCERLTIPHKLMCEREFVMVPLKEIK